jgi:hypothetical protein
MLTSLLLILFTVFDYAFDFWPLFLIALLLNPKNGLRSLLYVWIFWAIIRIFLFFNPLPITKSLLIPEPLSTTLFFAAGLVVAIIMLLGSFWRRKDRLT